MDIAIQSSGKTRRSKRPALAEPAHPVRVVTLPAPLREWLLREFRCPDCNRLVMRAYIPAGGKAEIACPRCHTLIKFEITYN